MKKQIHFLLFSCFLMFWGGTINAANKTIKVQSPDGRLEVTIKLGDTLSYSVEHDRKTILTDSHISMLLDNGKILGSSPVIAQKKVKEMKENITSPLYRFSSFTVDYNELNLKMKEGYGVIFRVYNSGAAYRFYTTIKGKIDIRNEEAEFNFNKDYVSYMPHSTNSKDPYAMAFQNTYEVNSLTKADTSVPVFLPVTVDYDNGTKLTITEADLESYPGMFIRPEGKKGFKGEFAPLPSKVAHNAWFGTADNTYYEKALECVQEIIDSGKYSLASNYTDPFQYDDSSCPEVIFGIPFNNTYATGNYLTNKCLHGASAATFGYSGTPWNGSCAVPQFIDTYDKDDSRLSDTWLIGEQYDKSGNLIKVDGEVLNYTRNVHSIDNPGAYPFEGARFHKYAIEASKYGSAGDDVPFFRYTDALMIKVECLLRLGKNEQTAADIVSAIRARAFKKNPTKAIRTVADLKGGSIYAYGHEENTAKKDEADNWVRTYEGGDDIELGGLLDDLAWEFVGEHHRRQDLIRFRLTSKNSNVYNGKSWFCKDAEKDATDTHKNIYPIHQDFLDANMKLVQNPGY